MTSKATDAADEPAVATRLVHAIRAGDRAAESEMVDRYSRGLRYLLLHLTGDRARADNLHQETFRIALERVREGDLQQPEKLAAFLRGTARNLTRAEGRRHRRDVELAEARETVDPGLGQLAGMLRAEEVSLVRQVVSELGSARDRQILYRFCIAEEDKGPICADLDLSSLQFNLVLFRARQRFKALYERARTRLQSSL